MLRMVAWSLSWMRIAPLVPRIVLMKKPWKPLVGAWVTMKSPMPSTMHDRLITMARFFAVRNRSAIRKFGDIRAAIASCPRRPTEAPRRGYGSRPGIGRGPHDHLLAGLEPLGDFG